MRDVDISCNFQEKTMNTSSEFNCEQIFLSQGPYWHVCTPGSRTGLIFPRTEDFAFGMTLSAVCSVLASGIRIITFELMSNHLHFLMAGDKTNAEEYFRMFRKKLMRYYSEKGMKLDFSGFDCSLIPVDSLKSIRNEIVYINRNGYVVNPGHTPFSYPWGAGRYYFNSIQDRKKYGDLSLKEKRHMCRCKDIFIPDEYLISNYDFISPASFCNIQFGMSLFRDSHQYFSYLSKNVEAYSEIAGRLNDKEFLTDDEMFSAALRICKSLYNCSSPSALNSLDKIDAAKRLHYDYHASNNQIRRILAMSQYEIDSLFPLSKKHPDGIPGREKAGI